MGGLGRVRPPEDIWRLAVGFELANLLRLRGNFTRAHELDEEVHDRQLRHPQIGPDHLHTLRTAGSIGGDLRYLGRWSEALDHDRATHAALSRDYGPDHPEPCGRPTTWPRRCASRGGASRPGTST